MSRPSFYLVLTQEMVAAMTDDEFAEVWQAYGVTLRISMVSLKRERERQYAADLKVREMFWRPNLVRDSA